MPTWTFNNARQHLLYVEERRFFESNRCKKYIRNMKQKLRFIVLYLWISGLPVKVYWLQGERQVGVEEHMDHSVEEHLYRKSGIGSWA